jgi:hypothetical protein
VRVPLLQVNCMEMHCGRGPLCFAAWGVLVRAAKTSLGLRDVMNEDVRIQQDVSHESGFGRGFGVYSVFAIL